jgi:deoxyribose-phosphate aldolase
MNIEEIVQQVVSQLNLPGEDGPGLAGASTIPAAAGETGLPIHLEHALLIPGASASKIREECAKARKFCVAAVNLAPYFVADAADVLRGSTVKVGSAVGIPNAAMSAAAKLADVRDCIMNGANEIDVAVNVLAIKSGRMDDARREMDGILSVAQGKAVIKAAFEHCLFDEREKVETLKMLRGCGIEFLKIQNVLSGEGASEESIRFAKDILGRNVRIKIDGGVKTARRVRELVAAGADRIGLSATFSVLSEG